MELDEAIKTITAAGGVFTAPPESHLSLKAAAKRMDCAPKWIREHLGEFPNAWRMPSAGGGGEIRIPERDVDALAKKRRLLRA